MVRHYLYKWWVETAFGIVLVIGLIISLLAPSATISYIMIFFVGMTVGRIWYIGKRQIKAPSVLVIIGFIIGYVVGSRLGYGNWKVILIMFLIGTFLSYWIHNEGYLK